MARLLVRRRMANVLHNRQYVPARIEYFCQIIASFPFATLSLSIILGYHAALSSIHPLSAYVFLAIFVGAYILCVSHSSFGMRVGTALLKPYPLQSRLRNIFAENCVPVLAILHSIAFLCTYNGIRTDIARSETISQLNRTEVSQEYRGQVISEAKATDQYRSYIIRIDEGVKILLYSNVETELACGEGVQFFGKLNTFSDIRNPGGFDAAKYYRGKGIFFSIYLDQAPIVVSSPIMLRSVLNYCFRISGDIRDVIINFWTDCLGEDKSGFLSAVMFGLKESIDPDIQSAMRMSNLSHLVAVSGLHVSMIIAPFISFISMAGIDRNKKKIICVGALIFLGFLTGYTPSVSRAVMMNLLSISNSATKCKNSPINNLYFSSLVMLGMCPYYVGDLGFILSFTATLGIILFSEKINNLLSNFVSAKWFSSTIATFCAAQIGMLPTLLQMSGRQSIVMVAVALIAAIPAQGICMITLPFSMLAYISVPILGSMRFAKIAMLPSYVLSDILVFFSSIGQRAYYSATALRDIPWVFIIFGLIMPLVFIYKRRSTVRVLLLLSTLLFIVGMIEFTRAKREEPIATLIIADVGQGDCILLMTKTRCVVIDGGDEKKGNTVLLPLLDFFGIYKPDIALLTHLHQDHFAGLIEAVDQNRINSIGTPYFVDFEAQSPQAVDQLDKISFYEINSENEIRISHDVKIQVLSPQYPTEHGGNEDSLVILLQASDFSALLMGDAGFETEQSILNEYDHLLRELGGIDLLKVGHHGSKYSTSDAFLNGINPQYAVVSVGKNYFGHPSPDAMQRIENCGAETFRTDWHGAVIVYVYNNHYKVETMLG